MKMVGFTACNGKTVFVNSENVFAVCTDSYDNTVIRGDSDVKVYVNCDINSAVEKLQREMARLGGEEEKTGTIEAEWLIYKGVNGATCSYCKHTYLDVYDVENYDSFCRHCGAKMVRIRTVK